MRLRNKIFLYFGTFIFFTVSTLVLVDHLVLNKALKENAERETLTFVNSVNTAAATLLDSSIRNYLRGIVEQNFMFLEKIYQQYQAGEITEQEAKAAYQKRSNEHVIGKTGYVAAVRKENSRIWIDIHPHVPGIDCTMNKACQAWAEQKEGYIDYTWKNPGEDSKRQKVAYFKYFAPWNWTVGATSYKDEFIELIQVEDLKELITPFKVLENGYFFVTDEKFNLLVHPELKNENISNLQNREGIFLIQEFTKNLDDFYVYTWKNPSESKEREKFVYTKKLKHLNWYIFATGYVEDIVAPIKKTVVVRLMFIIIATIVLILITLSLSRSLTQPLNTLIEGLHDFYMKKQAFKMSVKSVREIDSVGHAIETLTKNLLIAGREKQSILEDLNAIINSMPSMMIGFDSKGKVTLWNSRAEEYFGLSRTKALNRPVTDLLPGFSPALAAAENSIGNQAYATHSFEISNSDGSSSYFDLTFYPLTEGIQSAVIRIDDVTSRIEMEETLKQKQKIESLGTLAGGIAHDFNNILSAIYGYAEIVRMKLDPESNLHKMQSNLINATDRAKSLIQQILLFSRQSEKKRIPLEPHTILKEALKLIRSTIPTTIDIVQDIAEDCGSIMADPTQIHQIIMNLCTNSYHAMRDKGGTLKVSLSQQELFASDPFVLQSKLAPGNYIKIEVADTGHGMNQETISKIFDPFFTTKTTGEGTGLGLSVVHGIITSYQGHIEITSVPEEGTVVEILIPQIEPVADFIPLETASEFPTGQESILLIDDEKDILDVTCLLLEDLGYRVTAFSDSTEAIEAFEKNPDEFDLVITDMTMPKMTGLSLSERALALKPDLPVIICTGFSELIDQEQAFRKGIQGFLNKPVAHSDLANTIRKILDKRAGNNQ